MRSRFLVAISTSPDSAIDGAKLSASIGLDVIFDRYPILICATRATQRLSVLDHGVVLGTLFPRHGHGPPRPIFDLSAQEARRILAVGDACLLEAYWGRYVSVLPCGATKIRVLRDPSGAQPCYYAHLGNGLLVASDATLLLATGLIASGIDWRAVGRHHLRNGLPTPTTALENICELLPGCSLDVPGGRDQEPRWSPWDHVATKADLPDEQISNRLRRTIINSTEALTSGCDYLLVSVSGGLDSSIVASCLARDRHAIQCVTMYTDDPAGDERAYARLLCRALDLLLIERRYRVEDVDIAAAVSPHLPRPIGRTVNQVFERIHVDIARSAGIDAFVSGNGGDNVFGYSQSAAAIADRWLDQGLSRGVFRTLRDVCQQTGSSLVEAVQGAIRLRRRRHYQWRPQPAFLHREMLMTPSEEYDHPWLRSPCGSLPGKAAHIAALLRVQPLLEPARSAAAPVFYPLISQPVIEACLAIPSWAWRTGGRDRAVARDAFAQDLPDAIIRRRIKGGPDGFSAAIIRYHRAEIRMRLLEGNLAQHNIIDRAAIEAVLRPERPIQAAEQARILDLLDTEAWVTGWAQKLAALSSAGARAATGARPPSV